MAPTLMYRLLFNLILQRFDAERAHKLAAVVLRVVWRTPVLGGTISRALRSRDLRLNVEALGLVFPSPLGVAAGMDKDAKMFDGLGMLGFGFVEVGTVTAHRQEGNHKPRVWRLPKDRALLNRMGSPNDGARVIGERLLARESSTIVGINLGKSSDRPAAEATDDYRNALKQLGTAFDYVVLNVSSPNTPELRDLQAVAPLRRLVEAVRAELRDRGLSRPVLVKIAPDLSDAEIDAVADLALDLNLDGIIAINTTVHQAGLVSTDLAASLGQGGISGAPLKPRALEVLQRLRLRVGDRLVLVSVGGIETAEDAWERLRAGATLLQAHTGFVYGGPLWARRMNRGLSRHLDEAGAMSVQDIIGASLSSIPASESQDADAGSPEQRESPAVGVTHTVPLAR